VYVSNTDARNSVRFEGAGEFGGETVRGHLVESRITVLNPNGTIAARHLNKHIDYSTCCAPIPNDENARSLAFPTDMAITSDGRRLYVAAFGSSKIGVFDTRALESDRFAPDASRQIAVTGGGPSGLALDETRARLYALTRFDNSVVVIDTTTRQQIASLAMHNPEPASVVEGRRFLYDASLTSSHGDSACASCHVFGDLDSLAWDLGNPDEVTQTNPGPFRIGGGRNANFRALKGPMTTQSFRGMANHGPLHWRGDRTGGLDAPTAQPDSGSFDEDAAFKKFNGAFVSLNGRDVPLTDAQMQAFTSFVLQLTYPPNPIRNLDNSLTPAQQAGRDFYFGGVSDGAFNCNGCHVLDPAGNAGFGVLKPGFFGGDGRSSIEGEPQVFKIPHLRNMYQKIGMFGMDRSDFYVDGDNGHKGEQIRGFGFLHDGSTDTLFRFHNSTAFVQRRNNPGGFPQTPAGQAQVRNMEQFMLAFDSNLAPIVGQQVTLSAATDAAASARVALLVQRAQLRECELVARVGEQGFLFTGNGLFTPDVTGAPAVAAADLATRARQPGSAATYTCVPTGSGNRLALDRDGDGALDGDERAAGSNPADPASRPTLISQ
jgi:YVTN family beta-propeller protein